MRWLGTPLTQVALSSGFYDQSHFHRHFAGLIGLSPGDYRQAIFLPGMSILEPVAQQNPENRQRIIAAGQGFGLGRYIPAKESNSIAE
jgi:AraC-like DNA-binding protein